MSLCTNKSTFIDKMAQSEYYINSDLIRNLIEVGGRPFRRLKQSVKPLHVTNPFYCHLTVRTCLFYFSL